MGFSKWIVGALGWAIFGPIGGILAFWLASRAEETAEIEGEQAWHQGQRNSFLMSLLVLSASVIKADGKTTSQELSTLRSFFTRNFGAQAGGEAEEIVREILTKDYNLYEGVEEGLKYFKEIGIKLAVVTNKPQIFAVPLLGYMGIAKYFDFILGGEVLEVRKPNPEPLYYVLDKLNVDKDSAVMVGDSDNDIIAGNNAKMSTVFFTYGYNRKAISELNFDYKFDKFSELTDLMKKLQGNKNV